MKALLIAESGAGGVSAVTYELVEFARRIGAESVMFLAGKETDLPKWTGKLYLAESAGQSGPPSHSGLAVEVARKEGVDLVILAHSPYGWDLAPLIAHALGAGQVSEVVDYKDGAYITPALNGKLRLAKRPTTPKTAVTIQSGAFTPAQAPSGVPVVEKLAPLPPVGGYEFLGSEPPKAAGVDLARAKVVVSAGRGIGKVENIEMARKLAEALGGELGATRPVVDAGWVEPGRQVGASGQTVSPKLYIACGISGAAQHLAGMRKSEFIAVINTDPEAPIVEVAQVVAQVDLKQLIPAILDKLKK